MKLKKKYHPANETQDTLVAACLRWSCFGQDPSPRWAVGRGKQFARSLPFILLPAKLFHRQTKPRHETNHADVGLFIEITFNANASQKEQL